MARFLKSINKHVEEEEEMIIQDKEVAKLTQNLPKTTSLGGKSKLVKYQGFWYSNLGFKNVLAFQKHFHARDSDIIITSVPKVGNTWLKALLFAIVNRRSEKLNLLLQKHPHELVYCLESDVYGKAFDYPHPCHLDQLSSPRLLHTHLPYDSLPESIKTSKCRILSLTRNPLDTFVSLHYFTHEVMKNMVGGYLAKYLLPSKEDFLEEYCFQEKCPYGPFFDHVVGYWKKSLELPNKIIFLMYEDLKDDLEIQIKKIAEFIGYPFTIEEEDNGVVQEIINLCSFKNLKELEVNKNGVINTYYKKKSYFRKGEVGDWTNHFPPTMLDRMRKFMDQKIGGTGLSFRFNLH